MRFNPVSPEVADLTKQHPFLIYAGSAYTICVILHFSSTDFEARLLAPENKKKKRKLRRQLKPLPTIIKEKEPLWYRVP
jgi:hypothetical protein